MSFWKEILSLPEYNVIQVTLTVYTAAVTVAGDLLAGPRTVTGASNDNDAPCELIACRLIMPDNLTFAADLDIHIGKNGTSWGSTGAPPVVSSANLVHSQAMFTITPGMWNVVDAGVNSVATATGFNSSLPHPVQMQAGTKNVHIYAVTQDALTHVTNMDCYLAFRRGHA